MYGKHRAARRLRVHDHDESTCRKIALNYRSPAAHQLKDEHDQRDQQQDVYVCTEYMESDKPQQPQHKQNDKDRPKHTSLSLLLSCFRYGMVRLTALELPSRLK